MLGKLLSAFCAVALGCAPYLSMAANFDVNNPIEFQTALTTAQANGESDTINVAAGTYNVATNGTLTYTATASENFGLTITGSTLALTELDGGAQVPILRIDSTAVINDSGVSFQVEGMAFQNGNANSAPNDNGGALAIMTDENQQPNEHATIVAISDSEFLDNIATGDGGAVYVRAHAVEGMYFDDLTFDGNEAGGNGGSAYVAGGVFTTPIYFNNIDFDNGVAQGNGGGLVAEGFDSATPSENRANYVSFVDLGFYNNQSMNSTSGGGGGGADVSSLTTSIDTVGFVDNQAREGGGLRIRPSWSSLRMVNTGFTGNTANEDGGGMAVRESFFMELMLTNNTIYENTATNRGGGAFILIDGSSSIASIYNNIIYGNTAQQGDGDDLYVDNQFFNDTGAPVELFHNDITDYEVAPVAATGGATNIDAPPLLVDMTLRPLPDPRLQPGSPAIDTGDDAAPLAPSVDFESDSRPFDGNGDMTATIDIGMDEFTGAQVQNADLAVTKTDTPDPVTEGGNVTYTIVVTNNGPGAASNVALSDTLDELVAFVSSTSSQGTCSEDSGTVSCDIGGLANGASATVTVVVTTPDVMEPLQITNQASVSGTEPDPVSSNDSATEQTTVVPAGPAMADLAVTKSDTPDPVFSGGLQLTYTITVDNNGPDTATSVVVVDTLPAGVNFDTATTNVGDCDTMAVAGEVTCRLGTLDTSSTAAITIVVTPDEVADATTITNTATVSATEDDPVSENNTATESTTVNPPGADMSVSTSSSPGTPMINEQVTFSMVVSNNGPSNNTGVVVTVTLPAYGTFVSGSIDQGACEVSKGILTCTIGDMAAGATVNATIVITAPGEPMTLTLTATIAADVDDPVADNNADSEAVTVVDVVDLVIQGTSGGTGSIGWPTLLLLMLAGTFVAVRTRRSRAAIRSQSQAIGLLGILAFGMLLAASEAQADGNWYLGANVGQADLNYGAGDLQQDLANLGWTISDPSVNSSDTAWKAYAGFEVNKFFAFEAGYADLGEVVTQYSASIPPNEIGAILDDTYSVHPYQGDGWFAAALLRWPVNPDRITLYTRLGAFAWESDLDVRVISGGTGSVAGKQSGTDFMYGVGLEWHINQDWSLLAEWERYQLNEWLDVPSIGVKFTF